MEGRTVLFVSHNMVAVQTLCHRVLLLSEGRVVDEGPPASVISGYLKLFGGDECARDWSDPAQAPGIEALRIARMRILADGPAPDAVLSMTTPVRVETEFRVLKPGVQLHLTYHLLNDQGLVVLTTGCAAQRREVGGYRASFVIPGGLLNSGGYCLKLLIVQNESHVVFEQHNLGSFTIVDTTERSDAWMGREPGVVQPLLDWEVRRTAGGPGGAPPGDGTLASTRNVPAL